MTHPTPRALVLVAGGTNCDRETILALERAGAAAERIHIQSLIDSPDKIFQYDLAVIPGGFTYGDDVAAGKILAIQIQHRLGDPFREFAASGRPILGICNGFQVLVKAGLLPDLAKEQKPQSVTLTSNDCGRFVCRWVRLKSCSPLSIFSAPGTHIEMPVAHAEGKLVAPPQVIEDLKLAKQIAYVYSDNTNPNGSIDDIAGLCDPTGHILGLMPHPERNVSWHHHPLWFRKTRLQKTSPCERVGEGMGIFQNMIQHCRERIS
jgi:phosphoribosylformylglycinamidine synthase